MENRKTVSTEFRLKYGNGLNIDYPTHYDFEYKLNNQIFHLESGSYAMINFHPKIGFKSYYKRPKNPFERVVSMVNLHSSLLLLIDLFPNSII
jgi:hypothetical protein